MTAKTQIDLSIKEVRYALRSDNDEMRQQFLNILLMISAREGNNQLHQGSLVSYFDLCHFISVFLSQFTGTRSK